MNIIYSELNSYQPELYILLKQEATYIRLYNAGRLQYWKRRAKAVRDEIDGMAWYKECGN